MKTKDFLEKAIEFAQSLGMVENGANKKKEECSNQKEYIIRRWQYSLFWIYSSRRAIIRPIFRFFSCILPYNYR